MEISEKVRDFIPDDAVILGHNVFFDIAMLGTHGINLANNPIIDTFELSEIFSQDAASLNLGFLADFYNIQKRGAEHRALTDTWVAIDLFVKYLENITSLPEIQGEIWNKFILKNNSPLGFLKDFFVTKNSENNLELLIKNQKVKPREKIIQKNNPENAQNFEILSLESCGENHENNSEIALIDHISQQYKKLQLIVPSRKVANMLVKRLQENNLNALQKNEFYQYISSEDIYEKFQNPQILDRKYQIFLTKMLFWLATTKTGIVTELKYYGEEFDWLENFRLSADETNIHLENHEKNLENHDIIVEIFNNNTKNNPERKTIFRDIALLEGIIRKTISTEVNFEKLIC